MDGIFGLGKVVFSLLNFSNNFSQTYEANRARPLAGALSNLVTQLGVTVEELLGTSSAKRAAGKPGPRPDFDAATAYRSLAHAGGHLAGAGFGHRRAPVASHHSTANNKACSDVGFVRYTTNNRLPPPQPFPINYLRPF
ncbi:MAG TPA: hypothetical protein VM687_03625 [Stenotrophomonas sp.]|nr:hypothetical protein [Stenotrophomonas sp.]